MRDQPLEQIPMRPEVGGERSQSRGTSVPRRTGRRRITPDQSGALGDASPENRCKAAICAHGQGGLRDRGELVGALLTRSIAVD